MSETFQTRNAHRIYFLFFYNLCPFVLGIASLSKAMTANDAFQFGIFNFGHWNLFVICYLEFVFFTFSASR